MFRVLSVSRVLASLLALFVLSACTADHKWASDADVARAHYTDPNPPSITLLTSINSRTKTGAHAGLMINGSERVLFDPAGSWAHPTAPEREDLLYGMTPTMLSFYVDYQGTAPFQLVQQTIHVTPEVAEMAIAAAKAHGSANKAACTIAIASVLSGVPGFEGLPSTYFPKAMSRAFARLPGVQTRIVTSKDGALRRSLPGSTLGAPPNS